MAFTLEDYFTQERKTDPRYIKYHAKYDTKVDGVWSSREIPLYPCTEKDYEAFYPVDRKSASKLKKLRTQPNRGLMCLDWEAAGVDLYGIEASGNNAALDLVVLPCQVMGTIIGGKEDKISPECIADYNEQVKYLTPANWIIYYNQETVALNKFGPERIVKASTIVNVQVDERRPNWISTTIQKNMVADEADLLQFGNTDDEEYFTVTLDPPRPSAWTVYPTQENPAGKYKFTSIWVSFSPDRTVTDRQAYSLLGWLGDVGGLFDALWYLSKIFVYPVTSLALKSALLTSIFSMEDE